MGPPPAAPGPPPLAGIAGPAAPAAGPTFDLGLPPPPAGLAQQEDDDLLPPPAEGVIDLDAEPAEGERKKDDKGAGGIDDWTLDVDESPQ